MFLRGDYAIAVLQAFIEVEIAVRKEAKLPDDLVGVKLMRAAFHPENGPLGDRKSVFAEREALMHLYSGAIGHCKNPPSHRDVSVNCLTAARLIALASHLLSELESFARYVMSGPLRGGSADLLSSRRCLKSLRHCLSGRWKDWLL